MHSTPGWPVITKACGTRYFAVQTIRMQSPGLECNVHKAGQIVCVNHRTRAGYRITARFSIDAIEVRGTIVPPIPQLVRHFPAIPCASIHRFPIAPSRPATQDKLSSFLHTWAGSCCILCYSNLFAQVVCVTRRPIKTASLLKTHHTDRPSHHPSNPSRYLPIDSKRWAIWLCWD
jgi:hypothetical protein